MNNTQNPLTLPTHLPRRSRSLNVRLSDAERQAVDRLAQRQGITASALARHFLLQAVNFYAKQMQGEGAAHE